MRAKVTRVLPERALARVLDAFAQELIDSSDEEILEVAKEIGMNPEARMSAAFAGVPYPARLQLSDFFDTDLPRTMRSVDGPRASETGTEPTNGSCRSEERQLPTDGKTPGGK